MDLTGGVVPGKLAVYEPCGAENGVEAPVPPAKVDVGVGRGTGVAGGGQGLGRRRVHRRCFPRGGRGVGDVTGRQAGSGAGRRTAVTLCDNENHRPGRHQDTHGHHGQCDRHHRAAWGAVRLAIGLLAVALRLAVGIQLRLDGRLGSAVRRLLGRILALGRGRWCPGDAEVEGSTLADRIVAHPRSPASWALGNHRVSLPEAPPRSRRSPGSALPGTCSGRSDSNAQHEPHSALRTCEVPTERAARICSFARPVDTVRTARPDGISRGNRSRRWSGRSDSNARPPEPHSMAAAKGAACQTCNVVHRSAPVAPECTR